MYSNSNNLQYSNLFVPEVSLFWLRWNLLINIKVPFVGSHSLRLCLKVINRFTIIIIHYIICVTFFVCVYVYLTQVAFHLCSRKIVERTQLISVVAPPYPAPTPFPFTRSNYTVRFWWVLSASNDELELLLVCLAFWLKEFC